MSIPSDQLPLPFRRPLADKNVAALPLPFVRLLGQTEDDTPVPQPRPPQPQPVRHVPVAAAFAFPSGAVSAAGICRSGRTFGLRTQSDYGVVTTEALPLDACFRPSVAGMPPLYRCAVQTASTQQSLAACANPQTAATAALRRCNTSPTNAAASLKGCARAVQTATARPHRCAVQTASAQHGLAACRGLSQPLPQRLAACSAPRYTPPAAVPCEWYDIPVPPKPEPDTYICGKRPPFNRLPLPLTRRHIAHHAHHIPLPFACRTRAFTPVLKVYMIHHRISATFDDGQPLELLSASFTADTSGYCWQGSLTVPSDDFARLGIDARAKGKEAVITVTIDNESFVILAEEYRDNRAFADKSYTVTGRSVTARLGADYAAQRGGLIANPVYARQIADQILKYTGVTVKAWQAADWLIPGGVYSTEGKTPTAVLNELADAAGAFVYSHPSLPEISVLPRRKTPAWQEADALPDTTVPAAVITKISGSRSVRAEANGVFVYAEHDKGRAADVHKKGSSREPRAAALTSVLYTDLTVLEAAGIAALNEAGTHKSENVTLPVADQYALPRAELGQIWQIQEPSGNWQGTVTGVTLNVDIENDAPVVMQTVTIDRYLG
ncbi:hypothetical protein [Neisseria elongata]|uniref:hypothetical protein n=1 Tax=Neisseria elongata TaxID=495 RepID=UPI000D3A5F97|nr:hypothetical protein [Neisseria elongata]